MNTEDQHSSRWKGYPDATREKTVIIPSEKQGEKRLLFKKLLFKHNASMLAYLLSTTEVHVWKIETGLRELTSSQYIKLQKFDNHMKGSKSSAYG